MENIPLTKNNPIIERIRFLGIFSSNMDEFYRVRVAEVKRQIYIHMDEGDEDAAQDKKALMEQIQKKVLVMTHRIELCKQTSKMLSEFSVRNKVIDSKAKLDDQNDYSCFVAMVETLNNRLNEDKLDISNIGLVIIDEAHYNSFTKLFKFFHKSFILGVTATPLSSNINLPMTDNYDELIVGETIESLIENKFLARAETFSYNV